eukprot:scaffold93311_cov31-Tisochrysis_lutea.AAC.4
MSVSVHVNFDSYTPSSVCTVTFPEYHNMSANGKTVSSIERTYDRVRIEHRPTASRCAQDLA